MNIAGHKVSNWWLIGGGAGLVLVVYLFRKGSSSGSGSSGGSSSGIDPVTGLPYSQDNQVDPVTGMTYLQEAQQYGSVSAAEAAVTDSGSSAYSYDPYGYGSGYGYGGYVGTAGYPTTGSGYTVAGGSGYTSNAQWAQAVQAGLSALGYDSQTVAAALGLYLNSMPLNATDTQIVQAAVAEYGPPPVGSYSIIQQGNGTGSGTATVTVPNVTGVEQEYAIQAISSVGLHATGSPSIPGHIIFVQSQSPKGGTKVAPGSTVTLVSKEEGPQGGTVSHPASGVTVPNVVGMWQSRAFGVLSAAGLHAAGPPPVHGKVHIVTAQNPKAGSKVPKGTTVHLTSKLS